MGSDADMAIIDPEGLFHGERLAACSDRAQDWWTRLYVAANGYARLELSYKAIVGLCFRSYKKPPTEDELWQVFEEYASNFLVTLYDVNGVWWAQFDTSEKYLPRYKTRRDEESPSPSREALERRRAGYLEWKRSKSLPNQRFQKFSGNSGMFTEISAGVGVGEGVGEGIKTKSPAKAKPSPDARAAEFKEAFQNRFHDANGVPAPWDAKESSNLARFLRANPTITLEQWFRILHHRFDSPVNRKANLSTWVAHALAWLDAPAGEFGKPLITGDRYAANRNQSRSDSVREAANRAAREIAGADQDFGRSGGGETGLGERRDPQALFRAAS